MVFVFLQVLLIGVYATGLGPVIIGFGKNMAINFISSQNPELGRVLNFVFSPEAAFESEIKNYLVQQVPGTEELIKAWEIGKDPGTAAKQELLSLVYQQLPEKERKIIDNVQMIAPYVKAAFSENPNAPEGQEKGTVIVSDGDIIIKDPQGEEFARIPENYKITNATENTIKIKNEGSNKELEIANNKFKLAEGSELEIKFEDGKTKIKINGSAENVEIANKQISNIKDCDIIVNENGEIEYAEFDSLEPQKFEFTYGGKTYTFETTEKNSHVKFDPKNRKIEVDNFKYEEIQGKKVVISLDETGNLNKFEFKNCKEKLCKYYNKDLDFGVTSKKDFTVCLSFGKECPSSPIESCEGQTKVALCNFKEETVINSQGDVEYFLDETKVKGYEGSSTVLYDSGTKLRMLKVKEGIAEFSHSTREGKIVVKDAKTRVKLKVASFLKEEVPQKELAIVNDATYWISSGGRCTAVTKNSVFDCFNNEDLEILTRLPYYEPVEIKDPKVKKQIELINQKLQVNNHILHDMLPENKFSRVLKAYEWMSPSSVYKIITGKDNRADAYSALVDENEKLYSIKTHLKNGKSLEEALKLEGITKDRFMELLENVGKDGSISMDKLNEFVKESENILVKAQFADTLAEEANRRILIDKEGRPLGSVYLEVLPEGGLKESLSYKIKLGIWSKEHEIDVDSLTKSPEFKMVGKNIYYRGFLMKRLKVDSLTSENLEKAAQQLEQYAGVYIPLSDGAILYGKEGAELLRKEAERLKILERYNPKIKDANLLKAEISEEKKIETVKDLAIGFVDDPLLVAMGAGKFASEGAKIVSMGGRAISERLLAEGGAKGLLSETLENMRLIRGYKVRNIIQELSEKSAKGLRVIVGCATGRCLTNLEEKAIKFVGKAPDLPTEVWVEEYSKIIESQKWVYEIVKKSKLSRSEIETLMSKAKYVLENGLAYPEDKQSVLKTLDDFLRRGYEAAYKKGEYEKAAQLALKRAEAYKAAGKLEDARRVLDLATTELNIPAWETKGALGQINKELEAIKSTAKIFSRASREMISEEESLNLLEKSISKSWKRELKLERDIYRKSDWSFRIAKEKGSNKIYFLTKEKGGFEILEPIFPEASKFNVKDYLNALSRYLSKKGIKSEVFEKGGTTWFRVSPEIGESYVFMLEGREGSYRLVKALEKDVLDVLYKVAR
ncbi:MAG: hypothetical protein ACTSVB_03205 [Candidatus Heimdallarchaeaceae archaeon]